MNDMRIAIVHDWLTGMRGGEMGLEALCELYPQATIYTLVYIPEAVSETIRRMPIRTSFIQNLPMGTHKYRYYLPFFPMAIEQFDLSGYDVVISHSHCAAKGVRVGPKTYHVCYCYTPMRYAWLFFEEYFGDKPKLLQPAIRWMLNRLRRWDLAASSRVTDFIACSKAVSDRIKHFYERESTVIHCPVNTDLYGTGNGSQGAGAYDLIVSAFVPYKRIDLAIEAYNRLRRPLWIVGGGPCEAELRKKAGPTIKFLGWKKPEEVAPLYQGCRALIFPGEEDFGIVPLEAQACGKPVVAFRKGGCLETVRENETGVFFDEREPASLAEAVLRLDRLALDPARLRAHAVGFDRRHFKEKIDRFVQEGLERFRKEHHV